MIFKLREHLQEMREENDAERQLLVFVYHLENEVDRICKRLYDYDDEMYEKGSVEDCATQVIDEGLSMK